MKVRTRYAPSPTGFFHIGGARTALMNYLYAKHFGGDFIVRIEDTDLGRHIEAGINSQLNGIKWLGFFPDESLVNPGKYGPYRQTEKLQEYQAIAQKLLDAKLAYYCFCTKEELNEMRDYAIKHNLPPKYNRKCLELSAKEIAENLKNNKEYVIRLKMPDNVNIEWNDLIRGKMSVPTSALTDPVLIRSNGLPLYNFAVVIDDCYMQISHVFRGEEHLSNTPYQIAIKNAIDQLKIKAYQNNTIQYGHLSIIVDASGKKLSKRDTTLKQFIEDYQKMGYVPEAVTNFISLLSWSPPDNQEIKSLKTTIEQFDGTRISPSPAFFDVKKMNWVSGEYIKKMTDSDYLKFVKPFVDKKFNQLGNQLDLALLTFKLQISYAEELNGLIDQLFFQYDFNNLNSEIKQFIKSDVFKKNIDAFLNVLNSIDEITLENTSNIVNQIKITTGLKGKDLFMPIRLIAVAKEHGPEMNKILTVVGKKQVVERIKNFPKIIKIL